jgi:hypothetical protein
MIDGAHYTWTGLRPPDFVKPRFYGDVKFDEKVLQNY